MGVTNRNEVHYKNPDHMSSTESLHIPISSSQNSLVSTASVENIIIPHVNRRQKRQKTVALESPVCFPQNAGRRRQRRYKAVAELSALMEEEESEVFLENGIPHNSPFTTILENPELGQIWDNFTAEDEKEQAKLLDKQSVIPKIQSFSASYAYLSTHVKMTFKMMRSLSELERVESEIIDFFTKSPRDTYIKNNKSSFQRLLIHGVAQYYRLKSASFNAEDGRRTIKVENPNKYYDFCDKRLCVIVQINHSKRL